MTTDVNTTLLQNLIHSSETRATQWVLGILTCLAASMALWASAKIQVPFWPVPMTMQTYAVLMIGVLGGWRLAGASVALYLAEGAIGLPVFAGTPAQGLGLGYMMGPTGGYLAGFLACTVFVGFMAERGWAKRISTLLPVMLIGQALIFALGVAWLSHLIGWDAAIESGFMPFLPAGILKCALAAATLPVARRIRESLKQ